jgi:hypothetical protein
MRYLQVTGLLLVAWVLCYPSSANAVAFKMKNDSKYTLRARCFDRGSWRNWVVYRPGGWGDFAPKVKRREHSVEIQVWNNGVWQPLYYNHHGSRMFTRVVQAFNDYNGRVYFVWWDEPPGCRGAPPYPGTRRSTCLKPSGWLKSWLRGFAQGNLLKYATKVGKAYLLGG